MHLNITARHCEISDELRARAEAVLGRLATLVTRPVEGTIVFDMSAGRSTAEIRLTGPGGSSVASGSEKDHRTALDRAEDRIRRQLAKGSPAKRGRSARDAV